MCGVMHFDTPCGRAQRAVSALNDETFVEVRCGIVRISTVSR